ncbi:MAG: site-2 protease family protein [Candidatus Bathyarchaeota archaeon]|nr:site-2 protease family protein [Candidatus Bathyarchaeota archaeon]
MAFSFTPEMIFVLELAVFWIALYVIARVFHLNNHGLDVKPAYFMYKSKGLNSFLDNSAKRWRSGWKMLSNIGIAFSIGLLVFSIYTLANNLLRFLFPIGEAAPVFPVIIGLTIRLYWLPYFFVAVSIAALTHELAHGIVARLENIPVLSTGVFAIVVLFGAFVEPDEKEFEKSSLLARLRMLSAGSSTNLVTGLLVFLLMISLFAPPAGVLIYDVTPNGPLANSGLPVQRWDVIQAINGTDVFTYDQYSDYMKNIGPDVTLTLTILHTNQPQNITVVTVPHPSNSTRGRIGFEAGFVPVYYPNRLGLDQYVDVNLYLMLFWIWLLALTLAIFNMFPLYPFDGERVLYYPLERLVKKRKRELRVALNVISLGVLAFNMILTFWNFGLLSI